MNKFITYTPLEDGYLLHVDDKSYYQPTGGVKVGKISGKVKATTSLADKKRHAIADVNHCSARALPATGLHTDFELLTHVIKRRVVRRRTPAKPNWVPPETKLPALPVTQVTKPKAKKGQSTYLPTPSAYTVQLANLFLARFTVLPTKVYDGKKMVYIPPLAAEMDVPITTLRKAVFWLQRTGYITDDGPGSPFRINTP